MNRDFKIWHQAVTAFLRSQGCNEWCEGEVGGGYAIWGGPEVNEHIAEFNKQYLKANISNGRLPNVNESADKFFNRENSNKELVEQKIKRIPKGKS